LNKTLIFASRLLVLLVASLAAHNASATLCSMDGMQRSVNVVYSQPGQNLPCEVVYEKSSAAEDISTAPTLTLWRAEHQAGYCESRADEFVAKLQQLGWQCQATTEAMPAVHTESESSLDNVPDASLNSGFESQLDADPADRTPITPASEE